LAIQVEGLNQRGFPSAAGKHVRLAAGGEANVCVVQFLGGSKSEETQMVAKEFPGWKGKNPIALFDRGGLEHQGDSWL
jgi:hypothetical protein